MPVSETSPAPIPASAPSDRPGSCRASADTRTSSPPAPPPPRTAGARPLGQIINQRPVLLGVEILPDRPPSRRRELVLRLVVPPVIPKEDPPVPGRSAAATARAATPIRAGVMALRQNNSVAPSAPAKPEKGRGT
eukprot:CAMPEP_0194287528 /NCGR_PEP_ID=MMETSP0169-20130528/34932_1 /TAXON_ID=218684 /ORGANISM="Corethron pennatum, Strain L29A3" /LENGTH=134 /DNA_ID=CAMNT_0039034253 /DNA_START=28 /DNA_END=429 /DNA_ORIENTATION=-